MINEEKMIMYGIQRSGDLRLGMRRAAGAWEKGQGLERP